MSVFDRLDRLTSRAVDRVNAIPFTLIPMRSTPNGRPTPDPNRTAIQGRGIFDYPSIEHGVQLGVRKSYREANDLRALQTGRAAVLSIDRRHFLQIAEEPRQGDVIEFPSRPDLPQFDVISAQRDGLARLELILSHRGAQA